MNDTEKKPNRLTVLVETMEALIEASVPTIGRKKANELLENLKGSK